MRAAGRPDLVSQSSFPSPSTKKKRVHTRVDLHIAQAEDPRLSTNAGRVTHQGEIDEAITRWTKQHPAAHIQGQLAECMVPAGPIYSVQDMATDPHYKARAMFEVVNVNGKDLKVCISHTPFYDFPFIYLHVQSDPSHVPTTRGDPRGDQVGGAQCSGGGHMCRAQWGAGVHGQPHAGTGPAGRHCASTASLVPCPSMSNVACVCDRVVVFFFGRG